MRTISLPINKFTVEEEVEKKENGVFEARGLIKHVCPDEGMIRIATKGTKAGNVEEIRRDNAIRLKDVKGVLEVVASFEKDKAGEKGKKEVYVIYRGYENTFEKYMKHNDMYKLIDDKPPPHDTLFSVNENFLRILRDLVVTVREAHSKKIVHKGISATNIVAVNGNFKLMDFKGTKANSTRRELLLQDYQDLANVIQKAHDEKYKCAMPKELDKFLAFLRTIDSMHMVENIEVHPIFLPPQGRLIYLLVAESALNFVAGRFEKEGKSLNKHQWLSVVEKPKWDWRDKVKADNDLRPVYDYKLDPSARNTAQNPSARNPARIPSSQMKTPSSQMITEENYNDSGASYIRFGKNIAVHVEGNIRQDIERASMKALNVWPFFTFDLHPVLFFDLRNFKEYLTT